MRGRAGWVSKKTKGNGPKFHGFIFHGVYLEVRDNNLKGKMHFKPYKKRTFLNL